MLRLFFVLALVACSISCDPPSLEPDPDPEIVELDYSIMKEYYDLIGVYRDTAIVALRPAPPEVTEGGPIRQVDYLLKSRAQSVVALCTSSKMIRIQQEMLNTLVEQEFPSSTLDLVDRRCHLALTNLGIQFGPLGEPFTRMADEY